MKNRDGEELDPIQYGNFLVGYLTYKAQLAAYRMCKRKFQNPQFQNPSFDWDTYLLMLQKEQKLRKLIKESIHDVPFAFDFDQVDFDLPIGTRFCIDEEDVDDSAIAGMEGMKDDMLTACRIFSEREGRMVISGFLRQAEKAHHAQLVKKKGEQYSWKQYLLDLATNAVLREKLFMAYNDALRSLDFDAVWLSEREKRQRRRDPSRAFFD